MDVTPIEIRPSLFASPRYVVLETVLTPVQSPMPNCVAFRMRTEERDNARTSGKPLILAERGVVCRAVKQRPQLVWVAVSERFLRESEPSVLLLDSLQPETEPFISSLVARR